MADTSAGASPSDKGKDTPNIKGKDGPPTGAEADSQKSKSQLKAERRAKQEAQRAAKAAKTGASGSGKDQPQKAQGGSQKQQKPQAQSKQQQPKQQPDQQAKQQDRNKPQTTQQQKPQQSKSQDPVRVPDNMRVDDDKTNKKMAKKLEKQQIPKRTTVQKKVNLFNHLHQYERELSLTKDIQFSKTSLHPAILQLGLQYAEGVVCGSNARCIALLGAMKKVIADYSTPPQKELSRDLEAKIKPYITFLQQCRTLSVSMGNAIKMLKWHITHISRDMSDNEAKRSLCENIDQFLKERILLPGQAISEYAGVKIQDGDVILVYACSSLIRKVLCDAHDANKKFSVIVVDGRPKLEGRQMLRRLVHHGIRCSYVLINAVSYVMKEANKVFLGAHALLANGSVMSRVGSSQVALIAKSYNVPVLVCCETYKFYERAQTDSFVFNELGDPDDLVHTDRHEVNLSDWRDIQTLSLLNLVYDLTPPDLITMVITEIGLVPCTSVPVVLRIKHAENESN